MRHNDSAIATERIAVEAADEGTGTASAATAPPSAAFSAVRTGARPSRTFWIASLTGAVVVIGFAVQQSGGAPGKGDLFLFAALLVCAAGYTEGARLARHLPGWQVIGWALVLALP